MRDRILLQKRAPLLESGRELGVDVDITERRFPSAFAYDREGTAHTCVVRTHHDTNLRNFQRCEYSARNMARVDVARVRNDTAEGTDWFGR
jgi:hypothetical protein